MTARFLGLLAAAALTAIPAAAQEPVEPPFSYVLEVQMGGEPGGEWAVTQGPELGVARWSGEEGAGDVALVAGPAVGGGPAEPMRQMGGILAFLFDPARDFGPGYRKTSTFGSGIAIVDSVALELERGTDDRRIEGRATEHHRLAARIHWRHRTGDGTETPVVDRGAADLWFAPDLPFSWLPLGVHPTRPGTVLPLSFWWPEAVDAALARHGGRLQELGLLVGARTRDETRPASDPEGEVQLVGVELESSLSVRDVRPIDEAPDAAAYVDLARVPRSRVLALRMAAFALEPCGRLQSPAGGSFRFAASGPRSYAAEGAGAVFLIEDGIDDAHALVVGGVHDGVFQCTVVLLPGDSPRAGTFPVVEPGPELETREDTDVALGLHVTRSGREAGRMFVLERGEVRIDEAGDGGIRGRMEGEAWGLESGGEGPPALVEGLAIELEFDAVPAAGGP